MRSDAEAERYVAWLRRELPGRAILVQEYLPGPEYGVGLIGNPGSELEALAGARGRLQRTARRACPDPLPRNQKRCRTRRIGPRSGSGAHEADAALLARMVGHAKRLFARLGCRDYARFDFRCAADGEPRLLEVNPNPAWANDGKLAFMAGFAGIAYPDMLKMILDAALARVRA